MKKLSRGLVAAALIATLSGCGSTGPSEAEKAARFEEAFGKPAGGCVALDEAAAQAVQEGAQGDLTVHDGMAVEADSGVYYAAFRITAAGIDEVGVWALDGLPPTGIRSVDGYAQEFTTWPVLEGAIASPDARAAEACLDQ